MTFKGTPLLDISPNFDSIEHGQNDDFTLNPVGLGAATPWKPTSKLKRTLKIPFQFESLSEWKAFRDFIAARRANVEGFWLPIWLTDYPLNVITGPAGTKITAEIERVGLSGVFSPGGQFAFCAFIMRQGTGIVIEPKEISSIDIGDGTELLNLADAVQTPFVVDRTILCGMLYARLTNDQIEYTFLSDGIVQCLIDFDELPKEYGNTPQDNLGGVGGDSLSGVGGDSIQGV